MLQRFFCLDFLLLLAQCGWVPPVGSRGMALPALRKPVAWQLERLTWSFVVEFRAVNGKHIARI